MHLPEPGSPRHLARRRARRRVLARRCRECDRHPLPRVELRARAARGRAPARGRARGHRRRWATRPTSSPWPQVVDLIRDMGVRVAARGSGAGSPGQLPARHQRRRPDAPRPAHGALLLTAAGRAARHRHRRGVRPAHRDLRADPRPLRRRPGHLRLDDGHLPGASRDPRRRRRARACRRPRSTRSPRPSRTSAARDARNAIAELPELRASGLDAPRPAAAVRPRRAARRAAPAHRRCTRAGWSCPTAACSTAPRSRRAGWASR